MRVLILTHPRSGGRSLLTWICNELGYWIYHEPTVDQYGEVLSKKNIVVKDFPNRIIDAGYNINEFISTFDKVICHSRGNTRDVAISLIYSIEESKKNPEYKHHELYKIDDEWIKEREDEIERMMIHSKELLEDIKKVNLNSLNTTYEGVFYNKTDVEKITNYLGIKKHLWLDILDNKRRLRNGDIGMDNLKNSKTLI